MKDKDLMKKLLQDGWELVRVNGATTYYRKETRQKLSQFTERMSLRDS